MGDGYGDDDFKVICEQILVQKLTIDKVADVYPLTFKHENLEVSIWLDRF